MKKPQLGHCLKARVPLKRDFVEFKITPENVLPIGWMLGPSHFRIGQYVDVQGVSKGKGFAGTIKRWNFSRQFMSHGNSKSHRMLGSIGNNEEPSRVFPGKKMPGHLGNINNTVFSL